MGLQPVVLAGGSGSRLWPLSRANYPKPFLDLAGDRSLLQETFTRLDGMADAASPIVVCNEAHRFLVVEQTRQIGKPPSSIILEPDGRNTAPALTLAALSIAEGEESVMLVLPADQLIRDVARFQSAVRQGASLAGQGCMVTFGIEPDSPQTGYGYVKRGRALAAGDDDPAHEAAFALDAFVEKPDEAAARRMLKSKRYLWNSGIFMMTASVWLEEIGKHRPEILEACREAHLQGRADGGFFRPDAGLFRACPSDSIDYAVMERAAGRRPAQDAQSVVIPLDAGWSDIGAWSALLEVGETDERGNFVQGDVYTRSTRDSLLVSRKRLVAAVGLERAIVVETADAVLVADMDHVQEVKELVEQLKLEQREEQENPRKVHRPWGSYEAIDAGPSFQVKRLSVNPGAALSLQKHNHRAEHWVVVKGTAKVTRDQEVFTLTENQSTHIPARTKHRLENPGTVLLEVIEVQTGEYLGEDDIERFEDRYNRHR